MTNVSAWPLAQIRGLILILYFIIISAEVYFQKYQK